MPRKHYMTINVHETIQKMFEEFVSHHSITKTVALSDILEMYMIAKDENLYLELKKKYLRSEIVKQMLTDRDLDETDDMNELYIFMRLGCSFDNKGNELNGYEVMKIYIADQLKRGYTWFSTQSLFYGMNQKRVDEFKRAIRQGKKVTILFAVGKNGGGGNEIAYSANVLEVYSNKEPKPLPTYDYPSIWHGEKARIWIKIENLKKEKVLTASLFNVTSTQNDLEQVIKKGQFSFGYVSLK